MRASLLATLKPATETRPSVVYAFQLAWSDAARSDVDVRSVRDSRHNKIVRISKRSALNPAKPFTTIRAPRPGLGLQAAVATARLRSNPSNAQKLVGTCNRVRIENRVSSHNPQIANGPRCRGRHYIWMMEVA